MVLTLACTACKCSVAIGTLEDSPSLRYGFYLCLCPPEDDPDRDVDHRTLHLDRVVDSKPIDFFESWEYVDETEVAENYTDLDKYLE